MTIEREDYWSRLSPDHPDLLYELSSRMEALLLLPPRERAAALAALLDLEAGMPEPELREFLGAELRVLSAMTPAGAQEVIASLEALQRAQPPEYGMRRTVALQGACRDLAPYELTRLEAVMPESRQLAGLPPRPSIVAANGSGHSQGLRIDDRRPRSALARLLGRP
jgi:hypothetical protein